MDKFHVRHNFHFRTVNGEGASVNENVVLDWKEKLHNLCRLLKEEDIYNCDEIWIYFRALQKKNCGTERRKM